MATDSEELSVRLAHAEVQLEQTEAQIAQMQLQLQTVMRLVRLSGGLVLAALVASALMLPLASASAHGPGVPLGPVERRITALETKTAALTQTGVPGTSWARLTVTGDNVQIIDGSGLTRSTTGLGNLTIGYNARRDHPFDPDIRTGSHNLILGDENNYSSYGGIVAGGDNAIQGAYTSVTGGRDNKAYGLGAAVSGGQNNIAGGSWSSVSGGLNNTASFDHTSVSGGRFNQANGESSSVSGGRNNTAGRDIPSVGAGCTDIADGCDTTVTGGEDNKAQAGFSSVSGGDGHIQTTRAGWTGGSYSSP